MRKIAKRMLLLSLFVLTLSGAMSVSASAKVSAPSKATIYQTKTNDKGYMGGFTVTGLSKSQKQSLKSKNVKIGNKSLISNVQLYKSKNGSSYQVQFVCTYGKKTGSTTISYKIGSKTYKTKVTVKKYTNPVKSLKITNVTKDGKSQLKSFSKSNSSVKKLKLSGTTSNAQLKLTAASGWKITKVSVHDDASYQKDFKASGSSVNLNIGTLKKGYTVEITFRKSKGDLVLTYNIK